MAVDQQGVGQASGGEFDLRAFMAEITEILGRRLELDDPKVAARALTEAAVGQWRRLGGEPHEIADLMTPVLGVDSSGRADPSTDAEMAKVDNRVAADGSSVPGATDRGTPEPTDDSAPATPRRLSRIDLDGLKVVAGSVPGMPYRLHLLSPGGGVVKTLSGRGRPQDLVLWLDTAMRHLPDEFGWRLIGPTGNVVDSTKPSPRIGR